MDSDMEYFSLDINPIIQACEERGDIKHVRFPIRDFDPYDLRLRLPAGIALLAQEAASGRGKVYVHCTAGTPSPSLLFPFGHKTHETFFRWSVCV